MNREAIALGKKIYIQSTCEIKIIECVENDHRKHSKTSEGIELFEAHDRYCAASINILCGMQNKKSKNIKKNALLCL